MVCVLKSNVYRSVSSDGGVCGQIATDIMTTLAVPVVAHVSTGQQIHHHHHLPPPKYLQVSPLFMTYCFFGQNFLKVGVQKDHKSYFILKLYQKRQMCVLVTKTLINFRYVDGRYEIKPCRQITLLVLKIIDLSTSFV